MTFFTHGSRWLKADFHLHTKADKEFTLPNGYNPNDFIKNYISQLKHTSIQLGVIANHNKFDCSEYKELFRAAKKEGIYLMAGIELSVNDGANGIHAIIVFDYDNWIDQHNNYIEQFLTAAFEGIPNHENENSRCRYSIDQVLAKLDDHRQGGRDSFIVMAHVDQKSGFLSEFKGGRIEQLVKGSELFNKTVLAFQKLRTVDNITKLKQWYGVKPLPAFVEGSDSKNIEDIGKTGTQADSKGIPHNKECFVKLGDFNFVAVKYALKDQSHRISDRPDELNNGYIKSISFMGGKYDGQRVTFSREMNSIIGIRGSGKSAILEILRDVLSIDYGAQAADKGYKDGLIGFMLGSGGKAIIEIEAKGHSYRYEKIYRQSPALYQDNLLINTVAFDTLLNKPIYFGQKDLSSSGLDFEADLVRRLTGTKLQPTRTQVEQKKEEIVATVNEIKRISANLQKKEEIENRQKNIEHTLTIFREKGLEEKLQREARFGEDAVKLYTTSSRLDDFIKDVHNIKVEYDTFFCTTKFESRENQDLFNLALAAFDKFLAGYNQLKEVLNASRINQAEFQDVIKRMDSRREQYKDEFAKIRREINIPNINPDDFPKFTTELKIIELKLKEIERSSQLEIELGNKLKRQLTELQSLWHKEFLIVNSQIKSFNESSAALKIEVEYQGRKDLYDHYLKQEFRGTGLNDNSYEKLTKHSNLIEIYNDFDDIRKVLTDNLYNNFITRFKEKLASLLTFRIEDKFTIKYNNKPLSEHSLGQRASGLILFLLAQQDTDLIIIDQPEDDLDNQTIYDDVIKVLRELKGKIQFIFATHNANIPVLGDSEQMVTCECIEERFQTATGSIDNPEIQQKIVRIMEGGQEAFKRRKDIYESWKH